MGKVKRAFQMSLILFTHNPITLPGAIQYLSQDAAILPPRELCPPRASVGYGNGKCRSVHVDLFKKEMLRLNMSTYTTP